MATDIAKLNVELTATSNIAKEFNKLQARTDKMQRDYERKIDKMERAQNSRINKMTLGWKKLGGAIAAVASAAAFANLARNTLDAANHLDDMSTRLGIATEELSRLHFAAEQTGVSTQVLEMGLQRMVRRVGEAANGTGEARKALEALGVSAQELNRLSPDEQLRVLADAFARVENQGDKLTAWVKIFDTEAASMLQMVEGGSATLDEFAQRADALGVTMDTKTAKAATELKSKILELKAGFTGLANTIATYVVPAMVDLANKWNELINRSPAMQRSVEIQKEIFEIQARLATGVGRGKLRNPADAARLEALKDELRTLREIIKEERNRAHGNLPTSGGASGMIGALNLGALAGGAGGAGGAAGTTGQQADQSIGALGIETQLLSEDEKLEASYLRRQWMLDDALEKNKVSQEGYQDALKRLEERYSKDRVKLVEVESKTKAQIAESLAGQLASLAQTNSNELVAIGRTAAIVQATINAHTAATEAMKQGGWFSGPAMAAAIYAAAAVHISAIAGARALGGPVSGNRPYLVGERGPELVVPRGAADVVPNHQLGGGVNVTIVEDPSRAGEVRQSGEGVQVAVAAVMSQLSNDMDSGRGLFAQGQQRYGWRRQV